MTTKREALIERVQALPEELLEEMMSVLDAILSLHGHGYFATPSELAEIDRGLAEADRGEFVDPLLVEEELAKFRR
ncbi:MAG: hypothetical protein IT535_10665 [Bauldia sp.]|nr:hypothetical protein [Bauldia sp.]